MERTRPRSVQRTQAHPALNRGKVRDPQAGHCFTWDMAEKLNFEAQRTIDLACLLLGRGRKEASEVADVALDLWGISERLRKQKR